MSYEKEINDFIADEQIPYRTMFFYKGIFRDKLVAKDFESLFHKFYDATRIAFMDGKENAFNLLFNILWLDERIDNFNWEYSNLKHYQNRLFGRYKVVKQDNPVTVVSFLNREKGSLSYLLSHIEDEQIIFLKDGGNLGLQDILCRMSLADSNIPLNWQEELKLILKERVSDKLNYVESLLTNEAERNLVFNSKEILQSLDGKIVEENNTTKEDTADFKENNIKDNKLFIHEVTDYSSVNIANEPTKEYRKKFEGAIEGEELLKMFFYLDRNVELITRPNGDSKIIKYSAIYFVLNKEIQDPKYKNKPHWKINKKLLGEILDLKLKNSMAEVAKSHRLKIENLLSKL